MSDQPSVEWFKNRCVWYRKALDVLVARIATLEAQLAEALSAPQAQEHDATHRVMAAVFADFDRIEAALRQEASTSADARIATLEAQLADVERRSVPAETFKHLLTRAGEWEAQCAALQARIQALEAFVTKIGEIHICDDEPDKCSYGSGPFCGQHGDLPMDDDIKAARALLTATPSSPSQP